ncbi:MAG: hypothetical protein LBV58_01235 [Acholeplasmatales bacterium]|jgi:hypothetical protein|nr:hypothetical protein [Acholeplasmatales bacterium]
MEKDSNIETIDFKKEIVFFRLKTLIPVLVMTVILLVLDIFIPSYKGLKGFPYLEKNYFTGLFIWSISMVFVFAFIHYYFFSLSASKIKKMIYKYYLSVLGIITIVNLASFISIIFY